MMICYDCERPVSGFAYRVEDSRLGLPTFPVFQCGNCYYADSHAVRSRGGGGGAATFAIRLRM